MFISVIIPTYNRVDILKKCLAAILNQTITDENFEVLIVDDHSTDETEKFCKDQITFRKNLSYFRNIKNEGRVVTRNLGIKKAKGDLLVFLDNDLVVEQNFLQLHLNEYSKNSVENIAVVSNVTYQPEVLAASNFGFFIQSRAIGYRSENDMKDIDLQNLPSNFFAGGGSSAKKTDVLAIGMFDENLSKYGSEDELFGYKLNELGVKIVFCDDAKVIHHDSNISPQFWKTKFIEQGRYGLRTIFENEAEMINKSMFKYLIPVNKEDDFKTVLVKKSIKIFSSGIFRVPVEKFIFATDKIKFFNIPIFYRYITMAWVRLGFSQNMMIDEVTY